MLIIILYNPVTGFVYYIPSCARPSNANSRTFRHFLCTVGNQLSPSILYVNDITFQFFHMIFTINLSLKLANHSQSSQSVPSLMIDAVSSQHVAVLAANISTVFDTNLFHYHHQTRSSLTHPYSLALLSLLCEFLLLENINFD